jgi:hypothetical protein
VTKTAALLGVSRETVSKVTLERPFDKQSLGRMRLGADERPERNKL